LKNSHLTRRNATILHNSSARPSVVAPNALIVATCMQSAVAHRSRRAMKKKLSTGHVDSVNNFLKCLGEARLGKIENGIIFSSQLGIL
jgi:hypothetical protein